MNPLQRLYLKLHQRTYGKRLQKQTQFPGKRVVSVGNLSTGGVGKTPAVMLLATKAMERGIETMAVLRGYGGSESKKGILVSDGKDLLAGAREAGDEAVELAMLEGLRVAAGRDRSSVIDRYANDSRLILLDDAFQNPSVHRDHELVLLDATVAPEKIKLLPTGRFREDLTALTRAHTVLLTRTDLARSEDIQTLKDTISQIHPGLPVFQSIHEVHSLYPPLPENGRDVVAFCGIGNPGAFYSTLEQRGLKIQKRITFRDHHPYTTEDLQKIFQASAIAPSEDHNSMQGDRMNTDSTAPRTIGMPVVTTAKDMARIGGHRSIPGPYQDRIHVLRISLRIVGTGDLDQESFLRRVLEDS